MGVSLGGVQRRLTRAWLAVTDLETCDKLVHGGIGRQDARLGGRHGARRGQAFLLIDRRERRDASSPLTALRFQRGRVPRGMSSRPSPMSSSEQLLRKPALMARRIITRTGS